MTDTAEYQRGYAAGRRRNRKEMLIEGRHERVYLKCLELILEHRSSWYIGDEKVHNAKGYCKIAERFAEKSIAAMNRMVEK